MRLVEDGRATGRAQANPFVSDPVERVQVAVADDHILIGRLVVGLIQRAGYTAELACGDSLEESWNAIERLAPEFLLLDFDLGPAQSSLELLRRAVAAGVVVAGFTGSDDLLEHAVYLEAGATAVISKGCGPSDLVAVVELALSGRELMSPSERHTVLSQLRTFRAAHQREMALFATLTAREEQVLKMLAEGLGAAGIAAQCKVAMATVRSHIRAVLTKLGVSSQLEAAALARDSSWYGIIRGDSTSSILMMSDQKETGTIARQGGSRG
ncbi:MAG: response regulator transcription factor [bacterium]|nr:response regulator transcription factor [bacterium]